MASIINKEEFISNYLIGTFNREVMLFDLDRVAVRVKEHSRCCPSDTRTKDWSLSYVEYCPGKNKIVLKQYPYNDKDLVRPSVTLTFPLEVDHNGVIEGKDSMSNTVKLYLYERKKN